MLTLLTFSVAADISQAMLTLSVISCIFIWGFHRVLALRRTRSPEMGTLLQTYMFTVTVHRRR